MLARNESAMPPCLAREADAALDRADEAPLLLFYDGAHRPDLDLKVEGAHLLGV